MLSENRIVCKEAIRDGRYIGWYTIYEDGTLFEELPDTLENGQPNSFLDIHKDKVKVFGIYGLGHRMSFDTRDGVVEIMSNGKKASLRFKLEKNNSMDRIKITDRDDVKYNDLIQYKSFIATMDSIYTKELAGVPPVVNTTANFMGYKFNTEIEGKGKLYFTFILSTDISNNKLNLEFNITPEGFDWEGDFVVTLSEDILTTESVKLVSGEKSTINAHIG